MMWRPSRRTSFSLTYLVTGRFGRKMPSLGSCKCCSSRRRKSRPLSYVFTPPPPPPSDSQAKARKKHVNVSAEKREQPSLFWTSTQPRNSLSVFSRVSRGRRDRVVFSTGLGTRPPISPQPMVSRLASHRRASDWQSPPHANCTGGTDRQCVST